jgi:SAM-dependent methyltransferase
MGYWVDKTLPRDILLLLTPIFVPGRVSLGDGMEKFARLEQFLSECRNDIYPEPLAEPHISITNQMTKHLMDEHKFAAGARVLDVGCGEGLAMEKFKEGGLDPVGITFGEDLRACRDKGLEVHEMDQSFLEFDDAVFDLVWCRHCLEHSIFPSFTLSQFMRVLKPGGLLYVEVPAPDTACHHESNANHYSVLPKSMWAHLIVRTGFSHPQVIDMNFDVPAGPDVYWAFIQSKPEA